MMWEVYLGIYLNSELLSLLDFYGPLVPVLFHVHMLRTVFHIMPSSPINAEYALDFPDYGYLIHSMPTGMMTIFR